MTAAETVLEKPPAAAPPADPASAPRRAGTPRQFEYTRLITAEAVKTVIRKIADFGNHPLPPIKNPQ
jgi:hypothetical protein